MTISELLEKVQQQQLSGTERSVKTKFYWASVSGADPEPVELVDDNGHMGVTMMASTDIFWLDDPSSEVVLHEAIPPRALSSLPLRSASYDRFGRGIANVIDVSIGESEIVLLTVGRSSDSERKLSGTVGTVRRGVIVTGSEEPGVDGLYEKSTTATPVLKPFTPVSCCYCLKEKIGDDQNPIYVHDGSAFSRACFIKRTGKEPDLETPTYVIRERKMTSKHPLFGVRNELLKKVRAKLVEMVDRYPGYDKEMLLTKLLIDAEHEIRNRNVVKQYEDMKASML